MVISPRIMSEEINKKPAMNIRFSVEGYKTISEFCKKNGLKISHFCEQAVLTVIKKEATKKSKQ